MRASDGAVTPRAVDETIAADPGWYARLPLNPADATAAYLARIPEAMRDRGERYSDTRLAAFWLRVADLAVATLFLWLTGFAAQLRRLAARFTSRALLVDGAVCIGYFVVLFALTLPAEIYASFIRPRQFGFSDQGFVAWLGDALTEWAVLSGFYLVGVLAVYRLIRWRRRQWILWSIGVYFALRVGYSLLTPGFIEPLTNDFAPLPEGRQKQQIAALAQAAGVGRAEIVTGNASRQTRLPNAHVSGLMGSTRVSVDDNTLRSASDAMLRAVVGHELGHYVLWHGEILAATDTLIAALGFVFISAALRLTDGPWARRLSVSGAGDIGGLPIFWGAFLLWGFISLPVANPINRALEHQADLFSLKIAREPYGLAEFMIHTADSARLQPGPLEYALFYDHPGDAERVLTAMQWRARNDAPLGPAAAPERP